MLVFSVCTLCNFSINSRYWSQIDIWFWDIVITQWNFDLHFVCVVMCVGFSSQVFTSIVSPGNRWSQTQNRPTISNPNHFPQKNRIWFLFVHCGSVVVPFFQGLSCLRLPEEIIIAFLPPNESPILLWYTCNPRRTRIIPIPILSYKQRHWKIPICKCHHSAMLTYWSVTL